MDPIIGAAQIAVNAAAADEGDGAQTGRRLLERVLGPSADEIGEALRRWTSFRVGNTQRILARADSIGRHRGTLGTVPPRVAHRVIEEGSFCDDEVMAEYLSGVLAGGRTVDGRDDRAAGLVTEIANMSSFQVRGHYILYRTWHHALAARTDIDLGSQDGRWQATMCADADSFLRALLGDNPHEDPWGILRHVVLGLQSSGLIADNFSLGPRPEGSDIPFSFFMTMMPSLRGIELWGWAHGLPAISPEQFRDGDFESDELSDIPGIASHWPQLPRR